MKHQTRNGKRWGVVSMSIALIAILGTATALASHSFTDTPEDHTFHNDIAWMKDYGVTRGCNPPENTRYCPEDFVTRGQMAAFLHRLAGAGVVDAGSLDGLGSSAFVKHSELADLGGVPGPAGPPGPQGPAGALSVGNVTIREASAATDLVVVGNTYTTFCEPGEIVLGGGYEADFTLVDLSGVQVPILGGIGNIGNLVADLTNLDNALNGVAAVSIHGDGPVQDGALFGWQIAATANIAADITVKAICAG